jgi:RHS repeat-associated protein
VKAVTVTKQNGLSTNFTITYVYTPVGNIDHITYPNGTETDYGYNTLNRLTSVTNKVTASGSVLSSYSYTLNADGLRTGVTEQQLEVGGSTSTTTKTWTYDNLLRLTGEAVVSSISANSYTDTYSYDLVGNRVSKTHVVGTQTQNINDVFNNNDQLTNETSTGSASYTITYTYDPNGSLTMVTPNQGSGLESDTYGYDLQHRLSTASITRIEQGQTVVISANYTYDDSGYRAYGNVTVTIGSGSPTTTNTNYLTDTNNPTGYTQVLEEHVGGSSSPSMSYIIGLAVLAQTSGSGSTSYLMPDAQGSTRLVVDPTGTIIARYQYDAYGNVLGTALGVLSPPVTEILYTGQFFVVATLQYYLRARIYMPMTARFTTMDSYRGRRIDPLSLHKYLYTEGNPVNHSDPSGHDENAPSLLQSISITVYLHALNISARIFPAVVFLTEVFFWMYVIFLSSAILEKALFGKVTPTT